MTLRDEETCLGCGKDIDPDTCSVCGYDAAVHDGFSNHSFTPLGCDCSAEIQD